IKRPEFIAGIILDATTDETAQLGTKLSLLGNIDDNAATDIQSVYLELAERIDITPGGIRIAILAEHLAGALDLDQDRIIEDFLTFTSPFQHRKRGVETKLIIGNEPAEIDETLLRNISLAHRYF
ncbi:unnamed protein product, partial [Ectocarpus sp. 12 AP-2014]